jgi:DNA-binding PadR family transcriptional regulator
MISRELKAASAKPMVLSILSHGESYGYQIIQQIENLSDGTLEWSEAMLYPLLHRMDSDGLIRSRWEIMDNGRKRKYYSLTKAGEEALEAEKQQWMSVHEVLKALWGPNPQLALE